MARSDDPFFEYFFIFTLFASVPFFLIGLIVNIVKNKNLRMNIIKDKFFWIWIVLFLISLILTYALIYEILFTPLLAY